jgi:hypothetical protein
VSWENLHAGVDENSERFDAARWAEPAMPGVSHPAEGTPWTDAVSRQNLATDRYGQVLKGKKVEDAVKETHDRAVKIFKGVRPRGRIAPVRKAGRLAGRHFARRPPLYFDTP